jgi:hypothetical protein
MGRRTNLQIENVVYSIWTYFSAFCILKSFMFSVSWSWVECLRDLIKVSTTIWVCSRIVESSVLGKKFFRILFANQVMLVAEHCITPKECSLNKSLGSLYTSGVMGWYCRSNSIMLTSFNDRFTSFDVSLCFRSYRGIRSCRRSRRFD